MVWIAVWIHRVKVPGVEQQLVKCADACADVDRQIAFVHVR